MFCFFFFFFKLRSLKPKPRKARSFYLCKDGSLLLHLSQPLVPGGSTAADSLQFADMWDPCTTIRQKADQINASDMRVTAILQPNSCLLSQLHRQRSAISDHREGQLQGSMIWQTKSWTKKKGLNSAWHWFLPHPAWNHKSKSMQTQAAAVITCYSHWLECVFSRYFSCAGSVSKITVSNGKTPAVGLINTDHAIHFIHRFKNAAQNEADIVSHTYIYVCGSMPCTSVKTHMHFPL